MPRRAIKALHASREYNLLLRVPGWFKNDLVALCEEQGVSINAWATSVLRDALREKKGLPPPPPARAPLPGVEEQLRAYVAGEKLLRPCGRTEACPGENPQEMAGMSYCSECGIRVR